MGTDTGTMRKDLEKNPMINKHLPQVVVVDDEPYICSIIEESLQSEDYSVKTFTDPQKAVEYISGNLVDLVLTDLVMGEYSGIQMLEETLTHHEDAVVILMTAHPTVQTAISVLKRGAYDFLVKPFKLEVLRATIKRGLAHQQLTHENLRLKSQVEFLKAANSYGVGQSLNDYMMLVLNSCRTEFSAVAAGLVNVDWETGDPRESLFVGHEDHRASMTDDSCISRFSYTRSPQPTIKTEETQSGSATRTVTTIQKPIFVRRRIAGVINLRIENRLAKITPGMLDILSILANSASSALANFKLYGDLQQSYLEAITALAHAIEARDACTSGHTDRVVELAEQVARKLGWDETQLSHVAMGCTLHDIGKLGVPDSILNKPGRLTDDETMVMRRHPELGVKIIEGIAAVKPAIPYVIAHHEQYDGRGYPHGLVGEEIPIEGRLLAVVDTFDAILSDRPYRKGASLSKAVQELIDFSGTQFDAVIVKAFLELIRSREINLSKLYDRDESEFSVDAMNSNETVSA